MLTLFHSMISATRPRFSSAIFSTSNFSKSLPRQSNSRSLRAKHSLHNYVVLQIVAIDEEFVLELLTHAEEAQLAHICALLGHLFGADLRQVVRLHHLDRRLVRYHNDLVAQYWVFHLDSELVFRWSLL